MKQFISIFILILLSAPAFSMEFKVAHHDEFLAGETAADFLSLTLIENKPEKAFDLAHEKLQSHMPKQEFIKFFNGASNAMNINYLKAESCELTDYTEIIAIYFSAKNDRATGYFRIGAFGDENGYKIVSFKTIESLPVFDHPMSGTYDEFGRLIERKR